MSFFTVSSNYRHISEIKLAWSKWSFSNKLIFLTLLIRTRTCVYTFNLDFFLLFVLDFEALFGLLVSAAVLPAICSAIKLVFTNRLRSNAPLYKQYSLLGMLSVVIGSQSVFLISLISLCIRKVFRNQY